MRRAAALTSLLLLMLTTGAAHAKECKGVTFAEHVQLDGVDLTLNGLGIRKATFLKVNVYVAALYVSQVSRDPKILIESNGPAELILHFVHSVSADDLRKGWSEGLSKTRKISFPC
jgi:hypothetical protein